MTKRKRQHFIVSPTPMRPPQCFPVDMLRYDAAIIVNERSAHAIARSLQCEDVEDGSVRIAAYRVSPKRWEAYGWSVYPARDQRDPESHAFHPYERIEL